MHLNSTDHIVMNSANDSILKGYDDDDDDGVTRSGLLGFFWTMSKKNPIIQCK